MRAHERFGFVKAETSVNLGHDGDLVPVMLYCEFRKCDILYSHRANDIAMQTRFRVKRIEATAKFSVPLQFMTLQGSSVKLYASGRKIY